MASAAGAATNTITGGDTHDNSVSAVMSYLGTMAYLQNKAYLNHAASEYAAENSPPRLASSGLTHPSEPHPASSAPAVGGACGGATNGADAFIGRESGGNPAVFNTGGSGAYGCYQIMPGTWASSCSNLGPEIGSSPATQAACASRLPLSAWGG
jgi:hypothetical protein